MELVFNRILSIQQYVFIKYIVWEVKFSDTLSLFCKMDNANDFKMKQ